MPVDFVIIGQLRGFDLATARTHSNDPAYSVELEFSCRKYLSCVLEISEPPASPIGLSMETPTGMHGTLYSDVPMLSRRSGGYNIQYPEHIMFF